MTAEAETGGQGRGVGSSAAPADLPFVAGDRADWAVTQAARLQRPVVELPLGTCVVGDLHLCLDDPAGLARFAGFWAARRPGEHWVVLGDLFEYWVGAAAERSAGGQQVLSVLQAAVQRGVGLDLVVGNRDFLCGERFARLAGVRVHASGFIARFPDRSRVLVLHGDELCSRDIGYQRLKRVLRGRWLLRFSERAPAWLAEAIARRLRGASQRSLASKPPPVAEQSARAAAYLLEATGAQELVCGHAHRFRREPLPHGRLWWVVDAWGGSRDCLRRGPLGFSVEHSGYPPATGPAES